MHLLGLILWLGSHSSASSSALTAVILGWRLVLDVNDLLLNLFGSLLILHELLIVHLLQTFVLLVCVSKKVNQIRLELLTLDHVNKDLQSSDVVVVGQFPVLGFLSLYGLLAKLTDLGSIRG